jgi:hypothetical protein
MVVASSFLKMLSGTYMSHWSLGGSIALIGLNKKSLIFMTNLFKYKGCIANDV